MHTYMTKIISISDEAYSELSRLKNGLSFSKTIITLTKMKKKDSIMDFAGSWDKEEAGRILKELKEERKIKSRRMR